MRQMGPGRGRGQHGRRRRLDQRRPCPAELPRVDGQGAVCIEPQVGRLGAEEPTNVDVSEQRLEPFALECLQVVRPNQRFAAGLLDGLAAQEAGLPQRRTDASALHAAILARGWRARVLDMVDRSADTDVMVVVEIPTGSRNKYEWDPQANALVLDRMMFASVRYPADYGFVQDTLGEDGDPLDALVFVSEPTFPGCRIRARPVGLFNMSDEKGLDQKILCVPLRDPAWSHVKDLDDLLPTLLAEVEHFFSIYKDLEGQKTQTAGFADRNNALEVIEVARGRWKGSVASS